MHGGEERGASNTSSAVRAHHCTDQCGVLLCYSMHALPRTHLCTLIIASHSCRAHSLRGVRTSLGVILGARLIVSSRR
jgi:hypothetical protein